MKKALPFVLIFLTLFLTSCEPSQSSDMQGNPLDVISDYIEDYDSSISAAFVIYSDDNRKKIDLDVFVIDYISLSRLGEVAQTIIDATKDALSGTGKKLGKLCINYNYKSQFVYWTTKNYRTGEIDHSFENLLPNGSCTLSKLKSIYSSKNKDAFTIFDSESGNETTLDIATEQEIFISTFMSQLDFDEKSDLKISFIPLLAIDESNTEYNLHLSFGLFTYSSYFIDYGKYILEKAKELSTDVKSFQISRVSIFCYNENISKSCSWDSENYYNGTLKCDGVESTCTIDELIAFVAKTEATE